MQTRSWSACFPVQVLNLITMDCFCIIQSHFYFLCNHTRVCVRTCVCICDLLGNFKMNVKLVWDPERSESVTGKKCEVCIQVLDRLKDVLWENFKGVLRDILKELLSDIFKELLSLWIKSECVCVCSSNLQSQSSKEEEQDQALDFHVYVSVGIYTGTSLCLFWAMCVLCVCVETFRTDSQPCYRI